MRARAGAKSLPKQCDYFQKDKKKTPAGLQRIYNKVCCWPAAAVFSFLSSGSSLLRPIFIRIWLVSTTLLCAAVVYSFRSVVGKQNAPLLSGLGQRSALRLCIQDIRRCRWIDGACSINWIKRREIFGNIPSGITIRIPEGRDSEFFNRTGECRQTQRSSETIWRIFRPKYLLQYENRYERRAHNEFTQVATLSL